ncbi:RNA methyltransferase [Wenyingzhuangia sp. chi5]|uniref:tRNA (guanosine(18)-2'-O)-methyltransferase n=1 Tax=Wenyingzhuangia gilva TaxID=3057677 RepID=A0ABT8VR27_9FLAO|nr:RNA methyltransferase [Wenyingzhuangia sp. chi5]MDO3694428.1 RNA methyltransferase [Wenyingzhuangia sp. chi5]
MVDQQLVSYLEEFVTDERKALFRQVLKNRTRHFAVVLEDLYQKHNWSAVVRSCDVFGVQDIYTIENKYSAYISNGVGKGAQKWVDFHRFKTRENNTQDCVDELKAKGYQIIVTTPHEDSSFVSDFDITKKSAFVFGVEGAGASDLVMSQADGYLKIPMYGFTESLNVSVAAAITLQNTTDRLHKSTIDWQLTDDEKEELYLSWLEKSIGSIKPIKERFYKELEDKK